MAELHDVELIVVSRQRGGTVDDPDAEATQAAHDIVDTWGLDRAVVLVVEAPFDGCNAGVGIATAEPLSGITLEPGDIVSDEVRRAVEACQPESATIQALGGIVTALSGIGFEEEPGSGSVGSAGPPFPDPEFDRAVYDNAGVVLARDDRLRRSDDRCDRGPDRRRGRRLQPGRRLRDHDRGGRRPRPGPDGPVGRRPEGLRRRPRDPVRPRPEPRARPGHPVRRARLSRRVPRQQREAADLRRGHAADAARGGTSTVRSTSPSSASTPTRRRSTPRSSRSPARSTPRWVWSGRPSQPSS